MAGETVLGENAFLVSETDAKGTIIFANDEFCRVAEYSSEELVGKPHNMVRHSDMPKAAFKDLWDTVHSGKTWHGFVKNKTKSGGYYWVDALVYPYKNAQGEQCFISIRRKPKRENIEAAEKLYKTMS
jgi:PAS domain S-box-containing protein